jgi:hypothetical protein
LSLLLSFVLLRRFDVLNRIFLGGRKKPAQTNAPAESRRRLLRPVMRYAHRIGLGGLIVSISQRWLP